MKTTQNSINTNCYNIHNKLQKWFSFTFELLLLLYYRCLATHSLSHFSYLNVYQLPATINDQWAVTKYHSGDKYTSSCHALAKLNVIYIHCRSCFYSNLLFHYKNIVLIITEKKNKLVVQLMDTIHTI